MSTYVLTAQDVACDPALDGSEIVILAGKTTTLIFSDVGNGFAACDTDGRVSIAGVAAELTFAYLGYGNVQGDATQQAVFLRSVKVLNSSIEASGYRGNLAPVSNELLQLINGYLANNPIYTLDTTNPTLKLLSAVPLNMAVQNGRISFTPGRN